MRKFLKKLFHLILRTRLGNKIRKILPDYPIIYLKAVFRRRSIQLPLEVGKLSSHEKIATFQEAYPFVDNYEVISLDIFDTVIARRVHPPHIPYSLNGFAAEIILGEEKPAISHVIFNRKRDVLLHKHRQENYDKGLDYEHKLDDVLKETLIDLKVPQEKINNYVKILIENEVSRECAVLYPTDQVIDFLKYCKKRNKKIIAISDMYFSRNSIEKILEKVGLLEYFDHVYVSSEHKINKHSGKLYKYIRNELEISNKWLHIGDNFLVDVISSRKCGIDSLWINNSKIIAKKESSALYYTRQKNFTKFLEKKIRLELLPKRTNNFTDFINKNISLDFCNFVYDMLYKAYTKGFESIYFLERDGTLFGEIAEIFQQKIAIFQGAKPILCKKVKISRRKSSSLLDSSSVENVISRAQRVTLGFDFSITRILGTLDISEEMCDKKLWKHIVKHDADKKYFIRIYDKHIKPLVNVKHHESVAHLNKLGLFDEKNIVLCDVGWGGTIQSDIADYINRKNLNIRCHGFYYATDPRSYDLDNHYPATYFSPGYHNAVYLEGTYSAVEFFIQNYSPDQETLETLQEDTLILNEQSRQAILDFCHRYIDFVNKNVLLPWEITPIAQRNALKFFTNPPKKFVKHIKKVRFTLSRKQGDDGIVLVPDISLKNVRYQISQINSLCQWRQAVIKQHYLIYFLKKIKEKIFIH